MSDQLHLTDEQFAEILLGYPSTAVSEHLAACGMCSAEAANVHAALGDFSQQSKIWAERRAATHAPLQAKSKHAPLWTSRVPAWSAAALVLVLTASAGIAIHRDRVSEGEASAQNQPAATVSQATLKADNDLLSDIDGELRVSDSTTTVTYSPNSGSSLDRTRSAAKRTVTE